MLEHLFGSKTRLRLLELFFRNPEQSYFVREITRELDTQINAVRRELTLLIKADIIHEVDTPPAVEADDAPGTKLRKYYQLHKESVMFPELQALLMKEKLISERAFIDAIIEAAKEEIAVFILTGTFTNDEDAPTDMLIVGDFKPRPIAAMIDEYEQQTGTPIRFTFMTTQEFHDRREVMDKFLFTVFETKNVKVINKVNI